jgi:hypothetical protein
MTDNKINLSCNADARDWAREFCATFEHLGYHVGTPCGVLSINEFESWMVSWFANAMMAMHDFERQKEARKQHPAALLRGLEDSAAGRISERVEYSLSRCPNCGGVADNGYDRCDPPSPYYCTKCSKPTEDK